MITITGIACFIFGGIAKFHSDTEIIHELYKVEVEKKKNKKIEKEEFSITNFQKC